MKKRCISEGWLLSVNGGAAVPVNLPNDFCISLPRKEDAPGGGQNGFYQGGTGVYSKYLTTPEHTGHVILDIDGSYTETSVYLNENLIGMHHHGYTPFLIGLTEDLRPAGKSNRLVIRSVAPQSSTRWYSGGGLYRDVFLWEGGDIRIEPWDMFVTTVSADKNNAEVKADILVTSDVTAHAVLSLSVCDGDGTCVATADIPADVRAGEKTPLVATLTVKQPKLWNDEHPDLYRLTAEVKKDGAVTDTAEETFGIRTLRWSVERGLEVNGETVKLRGGCIHHTHAALGAADFPAAVERQLRQLKAAGYNAIRSSHNPPSVHMLELCDRLGVYLMDEAFDMWRIEKNNLDYHMFFEFCWKEDIRRMVMRDRNHPCVTSYSIGNEIFEKAGCSHGYEYAREISDEIRKYDLTRPVTSGVCGHYARVPADAPADYVDYFMEGYTDLGFGDEPGAEGRDSWAKRTEKYCEPLDIVGYNYKHCRYGYDHGLYPERIMWGSETWALTFFDSWQETMKYSHVLGDFCWTCYDNLGENGAGRSLWARDGVIPGISIAGHEWISCYQGDFDLAGFRRPQSYFREAIWRGPERAEAHIFTTHPEHNGEGFTGTQWHWYDVHETWTFPDEYLGKPVTAEIYTVADKVVWTLNGRAVGESVPEKAIAKITLPYERGTLACTLVKDGKDIASIISESETCGIC